MADTETKIEDEDENEDDKRNLLHKKLSLSPTAE